MSLIDFTKKILSGETCQDIVFNFGIKDDDPLLAHGNILGFYSPVFSEIIKDANNDRDASHRIQIQVTDSNKKTYVAFIVGIYNRFTDNNSKIHASKDLFHLVHKYQLPQNLVENIFSSRNVWHCLEFALASPEGSSGSFLLQKCEKMLKINKSVFKDAKALKSIDASTIIHSLKLKELPLKKKEVKEFIDLWKEGNKGKENLQENLMQIQEATIMIWMRDDPWQTPILNVSSPELPTFSVEYEPSAKVQKLAEDVSFVNQVEKQYICVHPRNSELEMDLNSEKNLKELGLNEDDEVIVKLKKKITIREMSGNEFPVYFKEDETVDDLKQKVCEKLEATGSDVRAFQLTLVNDKKRLKDGTTLKESGVKEFSFITVVIGDRKRKLLMDANIAADAGTEITASSFYSSLHQATHALPGEGSWMAKGLGPSWWSTEFAQPKVIGRLQFSFQHSSSDSRSMSFRVEVGNDNVNWTTVLTKENITSQECTFDLVNDRPWPSKFYRIFIERRFKNKDLTEKLGYLCNVTMNEVVWE